MNYKELCKRIKELEGSIREFATVYEHQLRALGLRLADIEAQNELLRTNLALVNGLLGRPPDSTLDSGVSLQESLSFDLSEERKNYHIPLGGWGFSVDELNGLAFIRLSSAENEPIPLHRVRSLAAPFSRLFLSNEAQPGGYLRFRIYKDVRAFFGMNTQIRRSFTDYTILTISNSSPFQDVEYKEWGNTLTVLQSSGTWWLKLNSPQKPPIPLQKGNVLQMDFSKLYVSGNGDGGSTPIKLYIGREA